MKAPQTEFVPAHTVKSGWLIFYGFHYYRVLTDGMVEQFSIDHEDCMLIVPTGKVLSPATWKGDVEVILRVHSKLIPSGINFRLP